MTMTMTIDELRPHIRAAWGPDTCYPDHRDDWSADNPAREQCGMTALVVQDVLGGDLVLGHVEVGGVNVGHHYWNVLPDGTVVDLTAEQFAPEEQVAGGAVVVRPPDGPRRFREEYELLRNRVLAALPGAPGPDQFGNERRAR